MFKSWKFWAAVAGAALVGAAYSSKVRKVPVVGTLASKLPGADA